MRLILPYSPQDRIAGRLSLTSCLLHIADFLSVNLNVKHIPTCMHSYGCTYVRTHVHMHASIKHINMCMCVYIYMYTYIVFRAYTKAQYLPYSHLPALYSEVPGFRKARFCGSRVLNFDVWIVVGRFAVGAKLAPCSRARRWVKSGRTWYVVFQAVFLKAKQHGHQPPRQSDVPDAYRSCKRDLSQASIPCSCLRRTSQPSSRVSCRH